MKMELVFEIFNLLISFACLFLETYCFYKFITGDKEERKTLWYGIAIIIFSLNMK